MFDVVVAPAEGPNSGKVVVAKDDDDDDVVVLILFVV